MKRSHSPDNSDDEAINEPSTKKSARDNFLNNDYYQIRRSKQNLSTSTPSLTTKHDCQHSLSNSGSQKNDLQTKKEINCDLLKRSESFDNRFVNNKKKLFDHKKDDNKVNQSLPSSSSSSKIEFHHQGFNIRLPSSYRSDQIAKQFELKNEISNSDVDMNALDKDKSQHNIENRFTNQSILSTNLPSDDLIRLREEFETLAKKKNVNYKIEYSVKMSINDSIIVSNSHISSEDAEISAYSSAITNLQTSKLASNQQHQQIPKTQTRVQSINQPIEKQIVVQQRSKQQSEDVELVEDNFIDDLKKLIMKQDLGLLFKEEVPNEYQSMFGRKIPDDWFNQVQANSLFKTEKVPGNFTMIRLMN